MSMLVTLQARIATSHYGDSGAPAGLVAGVSEVAELAKPDGVHWSTASRRNSTGIATRLLAAGHRTGL